MGEKMLCETETAGQKKIVAILLYFYAGKYKLLLSSAGTGLLGCDQQAGYVEFSTGPVWQRGPGLEMHLQRLNKSVFWKDMDICGPGDLSSSSLTQQVLSYQY